MAEIQSPDSFVSVEFEVFGKVQGIFINLESLGSFSLNNEQNLYFCSGVFFRKCTRDQGSKLGLKGWCRNTESGTVEGVLEGSPEQVNMM